MKPKSILAFSLCAVIGLGAAMLHSGCESADGYEIEIDPAYSEVTAVNQTVTLTATGWSSYLWTLEDASHGRLNRTTGSTVVYTVTSMPADSKDIKIKVQGTNTGVGATSTSNTTSGVSGSATIRHTVPASKKPTTTSSSGTTNSGVSTNPPALSSSSAKRHLESNTFVWDRVWLLALNSNNQA